MDEHVVHQHLAPQVYATKVHYIAPQPVGHLLASHDTQGTEHHQHAVADVAHSMADAAHLVHRHIVLVSLGREVAISLSEVTESSQEETVLLSREAEGDGRLACELHKQVPELQTESRQVTVDHARRDASAQGRRLHETLALGMEPIVAEATEEAILGTRREEAPQLSRRAREQDGQLGMLHHHPLVVGAATIRHLLVVERLAQAVGEVATHLESLREGVGLGLEDESTLVLRCQVLVDGRSAAVACDERGAYLVDGGKEFQAQGSATLARGGIAGDERVERRSHTFVHETAAVVRQAYRGRGQGREQQHVGAVGIVGEQQHPTQEEGQVLGADEAIGEVASHLLHLRGHLGQQVVETRRGQRHERLLLQRTERCETLLKFIVGRTMAEVDEPLARKSLLNDINS